VNLAELQKAVYSPLRDPNRTQTDPDDVIDYLNDAYVDIATRLELLQTEKSGTTSAGFTIDIPDGSAADPAFIRILRLKLDTNTDVYFTDAATWQSHKDQASTPTRTLGRVYNGKIELYPTPATGTAYVLRGVYIPSGTTAATRRLGDPTDIPKLPAHLHRKLVYYAQAQAQLVLGQDVTYDRLMGTYEQGLPEVRAGRPILSPGPDALLVEPGPFDRVTAKHI